MIETSDLTLVDHALLVRAMLLAADSKLFPDWEFRTLMGVTRDGMRSVAENWPNVEMKSDLVVCSVLNSLNNLLGYPHRKDAWIEQQLGVKLAVLDGLRAQAAALVEDREDDAGCVS